MTTTNPGRAGEPTVQVSDADEALAWAHANLPADPSVVVAAMEAAGWPRVGGRAGVYVRLANPVHRGVLIVPLDQTAPDYPDLMAAVLATLKAEADAGRQAQQVLDALANDDEGERP